MKTKVTIGITTYNLQDYISKALDSILNQRTNFNFKILIVDDCSVDATPQILEKYCKKYPDRIEVIYQPYNKGSLKSSNLLFSKIKTQYFSFLDGDDYWIDEYRLQKQVDFLDNNLQYTMIGGNTFYERSQKLTTETVVSKKKVNKSYTFDDYMRGCAPFVHTSSILLRNIVYKDGMPNDYILAEDSFNNCVYRGEDLRFLQHIEKGDIFVSSEIFSVYRIHDKGLWSSSSSFKRIVEGALCQLEYITIFSSYKIILQKRFLSYYESSCAKICAILKNGYVPTENELNLLGYLFKSISESNILKEKPVPKLQDLSLFDKFLFRIYKKTKKMLEKKKII